MEGKFKPEEYVLVYRNRNDKDLGGIEGPFSSVEDVEEAVFKHTLFVWYKAKTAIPCYVTQSDIAFLVKVDDILVALKAYHSMGAEAVYETVRSSGQRSGQRMQD